jgi:predicted nucleic acid-binding protein
MIIISDTSALTSLIQIRREQILPRLFQAVVISEAAELELRRAHTQLPPFLKVVRVTERRVVRSTIVRIWQ